MYTKKLFVLGMLSLGNLALADDVAMPSTTPAPQQETAPLKLPPRGSTMSSVEASFGSPIQREAAVGQPPITRWEYSGFVVYFEYEHVIHSVVK
jgi:hypothetical protein